MHIENILFIDAKKHCYYFSCVSDENEKVMSKKEKMKMRKERWLQS